MKYEPRELKETADISRGRPSGLDRWRLALTAVVVLVGGYLVLGWLADLLAISIPDEIEGRWFAVDLGNANADHRRFEEAQAVFDKLKEDPEVRALPYKLFLIDAPEPNAFAIPGGGVGVTTGLLDEVKGETGLAMVLAHELGHHAERHVLRALGRGLLRQAAVALLFGSSGVAVVDAGKLVADRQYAQSAEYDADKFGFEMVRRVYGTTDGTMEFFEWACEEEQTDSKATAWLRTHPLSRDRIARLMKMGVPLQGCELP